MKKDYWKVTDEQEVEKTGKKIKRYRSLFAKGI